MYGTVIAMLVDMWAFCIVMAFAVETVLFPSRDPPFADLTFCDVAALTVTTP
jgi:hypothetical protein